MSSLAYTLGRKSAPLFFKANWILKSLTGSDEERIDAEHLMGSLLHRAYEDEVPCIENNRLNHIAEKLTGSLKNKKRKHRFKLDQTNSLNACALPGGFIYISEMLFDLCGEDIDAIAFVLAHEIAHGIYSDANRRFLSKTVIQALLKHQARGVNPVVKELMSQLIQKGYSREQELRADRFAVSLTKAAGFSPEGGCRLFAMLAQHSSPSPPLSGYLSSHPDLKERIQQINKLTANG